MSCRHAAIDKENPRHSDQHRVDRRIRRLIQSLAVAAGLFAAPSMAATITWDAVGTIANDSSGEEILTNSGYQFLFGWNAHTSVNDPGTDLTVQGVTFYRDHEALKSSGGIYLDLISAWPDLDADGNAGSASWSGDFQTLMDTATPGNEGESESFIIKNLSPGLRYRVQILTHLAAWSSNDVNEKVCDGASSGSCTSGFTYNKLLADNIVGYFTADGTGEQQISFHALTGNVRVAFNAVGISAVPIPAALPLFGSAVAVLGFRGAWRKRWRAKPSIS